MRPGDIITYRAMCNEENKDTLQRGMNFRLHPTHSVLLMSTRSNAPYDDEVQDEGRILIYEGHDVVNSDDIGDPKHYDQPMVTRSGKLTQNGLFYNAAHAYKNGQQPAEVVRVYEKLQSGLWVYNGQFHLTDAWQQASGNRSVFKFRLEAVDTEFTNSQANNSEFKLDHTRVIPSAVKVEVWQRDRGMCVKCGNTTNLHYDHIIPYSRGGTSLSAKNIQLLCMSCNLSKRDKIE